ncbi:hypothetical protein RYX36_018604 [Vicia faba]
MEIAQIFCSQYYGILIGPDSHLICDFFSEHSSFVVNDVTIGTRSVSLSEITMPEEQSLVEFQHLTDLLNSLHFTDVSLESILSTLTWGGAIHVSVAGVLKIEHWHRFDQSFVLVPEKRGCFIKSDILNIHGGVVGDANLLHLVKPILYKNVDSRFVSKILKKPEGKPDFDEEQLKVDKNLNLKTDDEPFKTEKEAVEENLKTPKTKRFAELLKFWSGEP